MSFAKAYLGLKGVAGRALVIGACGMVLAGCDTLSSINPFDKGETYKPEIVANVPAEQIYNDGLARVQKKDFEGAAGPAAFSAAFLAPSAYWPHDFVQAFVNPIGKACRMGLALSPCLG